MPTDLPLLTRIVYNQIFAWASILISVVHVTAWLSPGIEADTTIIASDGALMAALTGLALLFHIRRRTVAQRLVAAVLLGLVSLSLWRMVQPDATVSGWLESSLGFRQRWPELLAFLLLSLVFLSPERHHGSNHRLFRLGGLLLGAGGVAHMTALWWTDLSYLYGIDISAAMLASGWIIMAGLALWLLSLPPPREGTVINRRALSIGLLFMVLSITSWYLLSFQFQRNLMADSHHAKHMAESAVQSLTDNRLQVLRRISSRWSSVPGPPEHELQEYFAHFPGLRSLSLADPGGQTVWQHSAADQDDHWQTLLNHHGMQDWLATRSDQPALRIVLEPQELVPEPLLAITVPTLLNQQSPGQLSGLFHLDHLIAQAPHFDPSPFSVHLKKGEQVLYDFHGHHQGGSEHRLVSSRPMQLGDDTQLELASYHTSSQTLLWLPTFYLIVALVGNLFAVALAVAIESAQRSTLRSRELDWLLRRADTVSHVQGLITQGTPLPLTLRALCELLEQELSAVRAVVTTFDQTTGQFHHAADTGLPSEVRTDLQAAQAALIANAGPENSAQPERTIVPDLHQIDISDRRQHEVLSAQFRALWHFPAISSTHRLLGSLNLYHQQPGEPDDIQLSYIEEVLGMITLAIEVDADRAALIKSEQRYASLFSENPDAVFSLDEDARFVSVNRAIEGLLGRARESFIGQVSNQVLIPEDRKLAALHFKQAMAGEASRYEVRSRHSNGHVVHMDLTNLPIVINGQVQGVFGIAKDITAQRQQEAELAFNASHDALTGLPNRSLLTDRLTISCQQARRHKEFLAVLFIDLDGFKPINDSLGHAVGDEVLIEVGQRLQNMMRPGDTLARFGGDEFVVILTDLLDATAATSVVESILESLARPYQIDDTEITLTASIGISYSDGDIDNPMQLVQQADMAMYQAKQRGRNHYQWYTLEINTSVNRRVALRNELQEAIDQEQFELHYQPIFQAGTGRIRTLEALIRWKDPHHGYRSPAEFIPLAEDTGQIIPISQWVMQQACRDLKQLRQHSDVSVSVNLSFVQFRRPNFLESVLSVLDEAELPREVMTLELTESILMEDTEGAIQVLTALRDSGIRVAIDDFGTGFSSLSYLRSLPVNELKIDRSFVQELTENPHDAAITRSIINMAHQLKLEVIAEGIETEAQASWLTENDCDGLQGFHLAYPTPLHDLYQILGAAEIK